MIRNCANWYDHLAKTIHPLLYIDYNDMILLLICSVLILSLFYPVLLIIIELLIVTAVLMITDHDSLTTYYLV